jgi:hypothetical protein
MIRSIRLDFDCMRDLQQVLDDGSDIRQALWLEQHSVRSSLQCFLPYLGRYSATE